MSTSSTRSRQHFAGKKDSSSSPTAPIFSLRPRQRKDTSRSMTNLKTDSSQAVGLSAYQNGVKIDFSHPVKPTGSAFVESFNGTFRAECLDVHWFADLNEIRRPIEAWQTECNESRPHRILGERAPSEFASQIAASRDLAGASNCRRLTFGMVQEYRSQSTSRVGRPRYSPKTYQD
jgi:hypothetical protein